MGRVLNIDLATEKIRVEPLDLEIATKFIGGMGYSSKIISDEVGASVDPLGPDNVIVFSTGPLTGTVPFSGRLDVSTKSPVNGLITMGNTGGLLGVALKQAGYDVLIVRNSSSEPVYIWIDDDKVEIRKANTLWGRDVYETTDILRRERGKKYEQQIKVAAIGPAGENMVKFASLVNEYSHAVGRCGIGAVMGSKKLKAISVRGTKKVAVAKPLELERAVREVMDRVKNKWYNALKPQVRERWGDGAWIQWTNDYKDGIVGIKHFQTTRLSGFLENNTAEQVKRYPIKPLPTCYHCPSPCFWEVEVNEGKYAGLKLGHWNLYSCVHYFGALCGIIGLPAIWKCKDICQKLGMDYFSAGMVLAFAMELYQRGIVTKVDTGGIGLNWGDDDAALQLLEQIAYRRGFGDILADGSAAAAEKIGKDAMKYAYTVKGDETQAEDPRYGSLPGKQRLFLIGLLDSPRGGDNIKTTHNQLDMIPPPAVIRDQFGMSPEEYTSKYAQWLDIFEDEKRQIFGVPPRLSATGWEGKIALAKWSGDLYSMLSSLTFCIKPGGSGDVGPTHCAKMLSACTGIEVTPVQLMKVGERIFNLQRMYMVKCGFSSKDDDFPAKFYDEAIPDGPAKGARLSREDIDKLKQEYYQLRGWDKMGVPSAQKLHDLELDN